jgi:hypothetical protein
MLLSRSLALLEEFCSPLCELIRWVEAGGDSSWLQAKFCDLHGCEPQQTQKQNTAHGNFEDWPAASSS